MHTVKYLLPGLAVLGSCAVMEKETYTNDTALQLAVTDTGALGVEMAFTGDSDGTTQLGLNTDFGFTEPQADWFRDVDLQCANECSTDYDSDALTLSVTHTPNDRLRLTYLIDNRQPLDDVDDYQPVTSTSGVAAFSPITLFLPKERDEEEGELTISWTGPQDWTYFGPFGQGPQPTSGIVSNEDIRNLLFAAAPEGALRQIDGLSIGTLSYVPELVSAEDILTRISPVLEASAELFPQSEEAWYYVTITEAGEAVENGFALGGTAVRSAFSLYVSPGMPFEAYGSVIDRIVAHEYFHNWNGVLFFLDKDGSEHGTRWFVEGFTEFYARRISYRSGLMTEDGFLEHLNGQIAWYADSEARDLNHEEVIKLWEENDPLSDVSYKRGDLIALYVDEAIRAASDRQQSLDDLFRYFVSRAQENAPDPTPSDVFAWIAENAGADTAVEVERLVREGGPIPLPARISEPQLVLNPDGTKYEKPSAD